MQETLETWVRSLGQEDSLEEKMSTHSCSCLKKFHGQRSLAGYGQWACRESDMIEHEHYTTIQID